MPYVINLYSDAQCKASALSVGVGQAGITGYYATKSNWIRMDLGNYQCYRAQLTNTDGRNGVILSGATPVFDFQDLGQRLIFTNPANYALITDKKRHNDNTPQYNTFFCGIDGQSGNRLRTWTMEFSGSESPNWFNFTITMQKYLQEPLDAIGNARTMWTYNDLVSYPQVSVQLVGQLQQSICFYKLNVWETNYFCVALGVSRAGEPNAYTTLLLIPEDVFKDKPIHPYVGPVSKDSANNSFVPDRGLIHDNIASRDLTGLKNPYGFNSGALKLCKLTNTAYGLLCAQIFNGSSGSILNQISQDIAALTGGNEHRNHEEVQAIQAGIMKIHLIPDITTIPTGAGYNISTIAGYKISGLVPVPAVPITDSMLVYSTPSVRILRTWKSYIDFEPYTTITLRIPYVGNINIPPSIIYDNAVSLTYHLDLFSGTLSVDIIIHDYTNGNSYIFSTLQANCAVSLPIAGTAAAGAPLLKIASGLLGVAMSGVGSSANNIFSVISGLQDTKKSVPFGNFAQSNISAYFDSRHCYAIIQSVNPSNAETFLADKGYVAHISGVVNDFAGSGTEMHCRFESVDLTGLSKLTEQEKQEVETMLKAGVHIRKV